MLHLGLKSDDIEQRSQSVIAAKLNNSVGFDIGLMRVGQPDRFERPEAQGFAATLGLELAVEQTRRVQKRVAVNAAEAGKAGLF